MKNLLLLFFFLPLLTLQAQDTLENQSGKTFKERIDISGYVQFQWNYTTKPDSITVNSASGGYFERGVNNRFSLRRGRFAVKYTDLYSEVKMEMDLNERGLFLNDFYGKLKDPWINVFELTGGIFVRPFGHELRYSSRQRDFPERSMVSQTIFPNKRDLGAMLTIKAPDSSSVNGLAFNFGVFGGSGGKAETNYKDFVGQVRFDRDFGVFNLGAGFSGLYGNVRHTYDLGNPDPQGQKYIFVHGFTDTTTTLGFVADSAATFASGRYGGKVNRYYYGADLQIGADWAGGKTMVYFEYMGGQQVSKEGNLTNPYNFTSFSPTGLQAGVSWSFFNPPTSFNPALIKQLDAPAHTFIRKFHGGSIGLTHEFAKPRFFVTFRYEWYDPNTEVEGSEIKLADPNGMLTFLSPADVKYQIFQAGIGYKITDNIKLSFHYDRVKNEETLIEPVPFNSDQINSSFIYPNSGWKDDIDDDIITTRLQIGF